MKARMMALLAAASLALGACASGASQAPSQSASPSEVAATSEAPSEEAEPTNEAPASRFASALTAADLPDPHAATGVTYVEELPDPEPIEGDFPQSLPATLTDVDGREVTVNDTSRILAIDIYGTLSRTIISLGFGDHLVGRTASSTEKQLADLPVVTESGTMLNTEAVLALAPSLIFADYSIGPPEAYDQLRAAGIAVIMVGDERSLAASMELIHTVAHALGVDNAGDALVARCENDLEAVRATIAQWAPEDPLDAAFLYVRGTAGIFFIFGSGDGATELIESVGARDVAATAGIESMIPANAESLVALDPEIVFTMTKGLDSGGGLEGLLDRPGVAQTRAGASQRILAIPDGISLSFGPQSADILYNVAKALYGVSE